MKITYRKKFLCSQGIIIKCLRLFFYCVSGLVYIFLFTRSRGDQDPGDINTVLKCSQEREKLKVLESDFVLHTHP